MDWDDATRNRMPMDFGDGGCQKRVDSWKRHAAKLRQDFDEVVRQRDVWRYTIAKLYESGKINVSKEEIMKLHNQIEKDFTAIKKQYS